MTNKNSFNYRGKHSDDSSPNLSRYDGNSKYEVDITHRLTPEQSENGSVTNRGRDISIEHPVEDVDELSLRRHLTVQFRRANRRSDEIEVPEDESVTQAFDESVIELVEPTLDDEGISIESLPVDGHHVKAILLYDAYNMDSWQSLVDHIDDVDGLLGVLGYNSLPGQSTLWRANESVESARYRSEITNVAKRAVDVNVCVGLPVREDVLETHGYDLPPVIDEKRHPPPVHRADQMAWADSLFEKLLEPITFDRSEEVTHSMRSIVAALAQAALVNGPNSARPSAGWHYDETEVPTASYISRQIRSLERGEVIRMFMDVNRRFVELASEFGFFEREYGYALDPTWITWGGEGTRMRAT